MGLTTCPPFGPGPGVSDPFASWSWSEVTVRTAEIYDPATGRFTTTGDTLDCRTVFAAVKLHGGKVLIAGGDFKTAEIYDPASGKFSLTGALSKPLTGGGAALLPSGQVLFFGDENSGKTAYLYNPKTGHFTRTGDLAVPREEPIATTLQNGKVLILGGTAPGGGAHASVLEAEIYDPATGVFRKTGSSVAEFDWYSLSSTRLWSGKVLVLSGGMSSVTAQLYNPDSEKFDIIGPVPGTRYGCNPPTLLGDGKVLLACSGDSVFDVTRKTLLYDPQSERFLSNPDMITARSDVTATLLADGKVLIAGGEGASKRPGEIPGADLATAELYDPSTGKFSRTGDMNGPRAGHQAILLDDGRVLIVGGSFTRVFTLHKKAFQTEFIDGL